MNNTDYQIKSEMEIYTATMKFIEQTNNIDLLKDMLVEALDNGGGTLIEDVYYDHIYRQLNKRSNKW